MLEAAISKTAKIGVGCFVGFAALVVLLDIIMDIFAGWSCFGKMPDCGGGGNGDVYMGPIFWAPFAFIAAIVIGVALVKIPEKADRASKMSLGLCLLAVTVLPFASLLFRRGADVLLPLLLLLPVSIPICIAAVIILLSGRTSTSPSEDA